MVALYTANAVLFAASTIALTTLFYKKKYAIKGFKIEFIIFGVIIFLISIYSSVYLACSGKHHLQKTPFFSQR